MRREKNVFISIQKKCEGLLTNEKFATIASENICYQVDMTLQCMQRAMFLAAT